MSISNVPISFKGASHRASRFTSVSQKAAFAAQLVAGEVPIGRPTAVVAGLVAGVSSASVQKALRVSAQERRAMVAGAISLADVVQEPAAPANGNGSLPDTITAVEAVTDEQRPSVERLLTLYKAMTPAARISFAREIGVARCWQPHQRHNGNGHYITT